MKEIKLNDTKKTKSTSSTYRRESKWIEKYYGYYHHVKIVTKKIKNNKNSWLKELQEISSKGVLELENHHTITPKELTSPKKVVAVNIKLKETR